MTGGRAAGLYGFGVTGVTLGAAAPDDAPPDWPRLHVTEGGRGAMRGVIPTVDADRAVVPMADGERWLVADRGSRTVAFHGPRLEPADLAHPYLSPAAAIMSRWLGREVFHGGAFLDAGGRAIAVLGRRDAGKSTLLASLAARDVPVLADDLVVVERGHVFAGPRSIDLRAEPSPRLTGHGVLPVALARGGARWRLGLPAATQAAPLGGWVFLRQPSDEEALDAPAVSPVLPPLGLSRIARSRGYPELPSDPKTVLDLAALPAWEVVVPRTWAALEQATAEIRALGRHSGST